MPQRAVQGGAPYLPTADDRLGARSGWGQPFAGRGGVRLLEEEREIPAFVMLGTTDDQCPGKEGAQAPDLRTNLAVPGH
jgi:hypothetical protein